MDDYPQARPLDEVLAELPEGLAREVRARFEARARGAGDGRQRLIEWNPLERHEYGAPFSTD